MRMGIRLRTVTAYGNSSKVLKTWNLEPVSTFAFDHANWKVNLFGTLVRMVH
jgi:hypothetical protein